jgi:class 3 adenylate cyclase/pimeloyl-ACP methyl ester carboxylesterase
MSASTSPAISGDAADLYRAIQASVGTVKDGAIISFQGGDAGGIGKNTHGVGCFPCYRASTIASIAGAMTMQPETRYTCSGDVNIAYQVVGEGPLDIVLVPSWVTNVEENWEEPSYARLLNRLASFARLILFDKRGTGLSDRVAPLPGLEERMDDVRAVMNAVGSERAALIGCTEGGAMCALFAATYPDRTSALIMYGAYAKRMPSIDYPWGPTVEDREAFYREIIDQWGGPAVLNRVAPSMINDERFCQWWASYLRHSASPGAALALTQMNTQIDIRSVLSAIRVPTLVVHRTGDPICPVEGARYLAQHIPNAKLVELPGIDHIPFVGNGDAIVDAIQEFLTGVRPVAEIDRVLMTVLFADIVESTTLAVELGDREWRDCLSAYRSMVGQALAQYQGVARSTSGDGFVATFDGPARAIRCASSVIESVKKLGLKVRIGLHTGECELLGDDLSGVAVHIGARVAALGKPGEILVSSTVKDVVAGSGIEFTDRGQHTLKGLPGLWHLYAVERTSSAHAGAGLYPAQSSIAI